MQILNSDPVIFLFLFTCMVLVIIHLTDHIPEKHMEKERD